MPRVPYNSVGGYSTGLTMTTIISEGGNITGVLGSFTGTLTGVTGNFSGLLSASKGISASTLTVASGATFSGNISAPNIVVSVNGQTGAVQYIVDFKRGWFLS